MLNTLLALTEGQTSGNHEAFTHGNYWHSKGILQDLYLHDQDLKEEDITFYDNGQELLLYTNVGTYACNYTEYCGVKFVTSIWNKDGLVLEYDFDYDSPISLCLYDLWTLAKESPEGWVYRLDPIYDKYGVDIVNLVRKNARYNNLTQSPIAVIV